MTEFQDEATKEKTCSPKEIAFVVAFTHIGSPTWGSATESARAAGYKGENLDRVGYQIKQRAHVKAAISERYAEMQAPADEALAVLSAHLRRDLTPYMTRHEVPVIDHKTGQVVRDGNPTEECPSGKPLVLKILWDIDLDRLRADGKGYLLQGFKNGEFGVEFSFAGDAEGAADKILKAAGRYSTKMDLTSGGQPLKAYIGVDLDAV